jgi:hypothetical protein
LTARFTSTLLQLARVGQDRVQIPGERDDELNVLAEGPAQHLLHRGDDAVEVEDLRLDYLPAGEREQLTGEAGRALAGPFDLPEVAAGCFAALVPVRFGRGGEFLGDEGHVVEDHGEKVVEVVCDPAGQLAEVLHALSLQHLFLRLVRLGLDELVARRRCIGAGRPMAGRFDHMNPPGSI